MSRRRLLSIAAGLSFAAASAPAHAGVDLTVTPVLGTSAPASNGWYPYSVRIRATSNAIERGTVEIADGSGGSTRAPFAVAPGEQVRVELPWHDVFGKSLAVIARDPNGNVLFQNSIAGAPSEAPLLFDIGATARLETALRGERVPAKSAMKPWSPTEGLELTTSHPAVEPRSGDPILPEHALGYASVTLALARSEALVGMPEPAFAALSDWVTMGGSLAVVVGRDEDLATPRLATLLGRAGVSVAASPRTATSVDFDVARMDASRAAVSGYETTRVSPSAEVTARLVDFQGGAIEVSRFGAAARHGLGEVHLLAFDPTAPAFVDDAWVRRSMVELVRHAWDRRTLTFLADGQTALEEGRIEPLRRLVDPNEGSRWSVGAAAVILVLYAVIAGPLTFRRAARRNAPLRALVELPLWSLATLALIVALGAVAKGGRARARRITLVEMAAGTSRGAITRLRALFASSARSLSVQASGASNLMDVAGAANGVSRSLVVERGETRLEDLQGRPWETLFIREDGLVDLGGQVTFRDAKGAFTIENGLPRDLVAVVARAPGGDLHYFPRIVRGSKVALDSGTVVGTPTGITAAGTTAGPGSGTAYTYRLDAYRFAGAANATAPGVGDTWSALESIASPEVDFWPDDGPVLLAALEGGEKVSSDSGLAVDRDVLLVRVLGTKTPRATASIAVDGSGGPP